MAGEDWWQSSNEENEKILLIGQRVTKKNMMEVGDYGKMYLEAGTIKKKKKEKSRCEK